MNTEMAKSTEEWPYLRTGAVKARVFTFETLIVKSKPTHSKLRTDLTYVCLECRTFAPVSSFLCSTLSDGKIVVTNLKLHLSTCNLLIESTPTRLVA